MTPLRCDSFSTGSAPRGRRLLESISSTPLAAQMGQTLRHSRGERAMEGEVDRGMVVLRGVVLTTDQIIPVSGVLALKYAHFGKINLL